jgi:hypothetical protein
MDEVFGTYRVSGGVTLPRDGEANWQLGGHVRLCASYGHGRNVTVCPLSRSPTVLWVLVARSWRIALLRPARFERASMVG